MSDQFFFVRLPRFLYQKVGIERGVGRLVMSIARKRKSLQSLPVEMADGRVLTLDLREVMCLPYLLAGEIWEEGGETKLIRHLVEAGDHVIDVGTNVGWYSSLLSEKVGSEGKVWGFEPGKRAYSLVSDTGRQYPQFTVFNLALSDFTGESLFHIAPDAGQSSLNVDTARSVTDTVRVTTLDSFATEHGIQGLKFIKCDAEGAELSILRGACDIIGGGQPPIWMLEISRQHLAAFGCSPEDVFSFFRSFEDHDYRFFRINSQTGLLENLPIGLDFRFDAVIVPESRMGSIANYL
jgi:FkbM family methyltransferase